MKLIACQQGSSAFIYRYQIIYGVYCKEKEYIF